MSRYFSLLWEEVTTHQVSSERGERGERGVRLERREISLSLSQITGKKANITDNSISLSLSLCYSFKGYTQNWDFSWKDLDKKYVG